MITFVSGGSGGGRVTSAAMSQLSLFSAAAREPQLSDLEGLLAGPGQVVRRQMSGGRGRGGEGQDAARVSVVVPTGWRVGGLVTELGALGLEAEVEDVPPDGPIVCPVAVRTPWLPTLRGLADAWTRGAVKQPPEHWLLDGPRLRWWCIAAGSAGTGMYTLALGVNDEPAWPAVGAALAAAGIPGLLVGPRADGPAYRIVGQRRLNRLRELVGDPPDGAPPTGWPAADYARGA
jgi:hypothetical protein